MAASPTSPCVPPFSGDASPTPIGGDAPPPLLTRPPGQKGKGTGDARTWQLELPITKPLSMNSRQHWRAKAKDVAAVRAAANRLAREAHIPALEQIIVELHYSPRDRRRRDALNLVATLKPCEDGLVDAGVVPDDTAEYVIPTMPILDPPNGKAGRLYLIVREATP